MIVINWKGKRLTGEQALVLMRIASRFSSLEQKDAAVEFEHELCEGLITCKGTKTIGTFAGMIFHTYLGTYRGEPWTYEFLLTNSFDESNTYEDSFGMWLTKTDAGQPNIAIVDQPKVAKAKTRVLRRN